MPGKDCSSVNTVRTVTGGGRNRTRIFERLNSAMRPKSSYFSRSTTKPRANQHDDDDDDVDDDDALC